ncbi:hypothetical protein [Miniphocaeibacter massiliensis]|uniref:hypothetical protein n=1 Tax=Miniphocaeibacter massiliensis TaxID=2041841 RepID=UPI000C1B92FD|nr:hypothetical protein [Miniphocaeibacter massiliensis]
MKLYFGNRDTLISSIILIINTCYMLWGYINRFKINRWGIAIILFLLINGLFWYFANIRDLYSNSIVHAIDKSVDNGLFSVGSIQSIVFWIGMIAIWILGIISIFKVEYRQSIFTIMIFIGFIQISFIEISRIILFFSSPNYFDYL